MFDRVTEIQVTNAIHIKDLRAFMAFKRRPKLIFQGFYPEAKLAEYEATLGPYQIDQSSVNPIHSSYVWE